ncbi:hypothetical protein ACVRWD_08990, partial [Streptococcus varani]
YPFLSPLPRDSQAWESLLGSPVAGAHGGLAPQMYDMPVVLQKKTGKTRLFSFFLFQSDFFILTLYQLG